MEVIQNTETTLDKNKIKDYKNLMYWPLFENLSINPEEVEFHFDKAKFEIAVMSEGKLIGYISREERARIVK